MKRTITVDEMAQSLNLTVLHAGERNTIDIDSSDLNRPGLQMSGFFEYFAVNRVQLFGMVEITYLQSLNHEQRLTVLDKYFSFPIPCVLIGRNLIPPEEFIECARKYDVPILMSG